jgi:hypothetical protein
MMPHSTDVGQSGPPTRIATLATPKPGLPRMSFIVLIIGELTPTTWRTKTFLPSSTPNTYERTRGATNGTH